MLTDQGIPIQKGILFKDKMKQINFENYFYNCDKSKKFKGICIKYRYKKLSLLKQEYLKFRF